ncbi:hypothetical protein PRIPAC_82942 [Pristionchus pacificus]|uniref:Uncharacterized protein n=1 Tax=Pristionchus pacificus TaxID=54126 RepID=A0A2A6C274_PRIPA|nr:hypothetical protein PRIPAC_82942 [Pristionchus pacificus]|eukprot:PDM72121.1 hypothetical protein PRIPAC_38555 [Pristionchus pacificus]
MGDTRPVAQADGRGFSKLEMEESGGESRQLVASARMKNYNISSMLYLVSLCTYQWKGEGKDSWIHDGFLFPLAFFRIFSAANLRRAFGLLDLKNSDFFGPSLAFSGECTRTLNIGPNISVWYENITREILAGVA